MSSVAGAVDNADESASSIIDCAIVQKIMVLSA